MNDTSIHRLRFVLSVGSLLLCFGLLNEAVSLKLITQLELLAYDWRMTARPPADNIDSRIAIIDIDERSLAAEGQWPWPRTRIAKLITTLATDYQTSAIGLDILFPESDRNPLADRKLGATLEHHQVVMAQLFQLEQSSRPLQVANLSSGSKTNHQPPPPLAEGYIGNSSSVLQHNRAGHISIDIDTDGKARRLPALVSFADNSYESLPVAMLRQLFDITRLDSASNTNPLNSARQLRAAAFQIPMDHTGRMLIPYQGSAGQYMYIPATDVLQKTVEPELLQGTLVLVGSSATGLFDLISTPWSKNYPGVEVHANVLSAILDSRLLTEPAGSDVLLMGLCSLLFMLIMRCYQRKGILYATLLPAILAISWLSLNWLMWDHYQLAFDIIPPLLLLALLILINTPALALLATRQRQNLFHHFQDYVPRTVVEQLIRQNNKDSIQPERRDMTVMFMDIRGFTSIAETLTPTQLSELMTQVLSPVTRIIHEQGGTIDKYMGDAVMAFWGAPLAQADHAERAVSTALAIRQALASLNNQLRDNHFPEIQVGIGINTGNMTVGNMGSDFRVSYTVIGDAVNIASRLEGLTKKYKTDILIGGATAEQITNKSLCHYLGESVIKGRSKRVSLYMLQESSKHQ